MALASMGSTKIMAIGAANQIIVSDVDDPASSGIGKSGKGDQREGNGGVVIHHFCAANRVQDFTLLVTTRNSGRGRENLMLTAGSRYGQVCMKPTAFAQWQIFKMCASTFTPASFAYADGHIKIVPFETEAGVLLSLSDQSERAYFDGLQAESGYCIPLVNCKGDRALSLVTFDAVPQADKLGNLYFKLLKIFETIDINAALESGRAAGRLTSREIECLKWVADGKTSLEIAAITSLSVHTINHYLKICCGKLNTVNRIQAAVVAARQELI